RVSGMLRSGPLRRTARSTEPADVQPAVHDVRVRHGLLALGPGTAHARGRERIMRLPAVLAIIVPLAACAASRTLERPAPPAAAVAPRGDANARSPPPPPRP